MNERIYIELEEKLGYCFTDPKLLRQALTHSSYVNENGFDRLSNNERLEFLGDSLLGVIISTLIYNHYTTFTEGEMTKLRARLVCESKLCALALELDLGAYLLLGHGEDGSGGRKRPSILADAFEAVIAAIYLDGGMEPARRFIEKIYNEQIYKLKDKSKDYKSLLQEYVQTIPGMSHTYNLVAEEGPSHDKTFTVEVLINGKVKGMGSGKSKKLAEQAAAKEALEKLEGE